MEHAKVIKTKREKKYTPRADRERDPVPLDETLAMLWARKKQLKK